MYLDRDYRPRRRRRGFLGSLWPLVVLLGIAIAFYITRPSWLAPRVSMPTPTPTLSVVAFVADAQNALSRGDNAAALAAYQKIAALETTNPDPLTEQSRLYMIEQNIAAAYETASSAVERAPKDANALTALARAEDWLGQFDSALNHALDALEVDPTNVETLAVLAEIYTDVGNQDIAQQRLDEALALDPNHVLALRNQAYLYEKRGKYPEAIDALDKALAQDPQRSDLFMEKGAHLPRGPGRFPEGD